MKLAITEFYLNISDSKINELVTTDDTSTSLLP